MENTEETKVPRICLKNGSKALIFTLLAENQNKFIDSLKELNTKEFCDVYMQLLKLITPRDIKVGSNATNNIAATIKELSINIISNNKNALEK